MFLFRQSLGGWHAPLAVLPSDVKRQRRLIWKGVMELLSHLSKRRSIKDVPSERPKASKLLPPVY